LREEQQWIPRTTAFLQPPRSDPDETGRWSNDCIRCHATHGRANIQRFADGATYDAQDVNTRVAELGIACEACHGPGEQHVAANRSPLRRYGQYWDDTGDDTIIHPGRLSHKQSAQVCGQCHGIFTTHNDESLAELLQDGWRYRPGDDLDDSKLRFLNRCGRGTSEKEREDWEHYFWSDGRVRVSGREYNGLVESPCFQDGDMSCLHCHRMHQSESDTRPATEWANDQLDIGMAGNQACLQCHTQMQDDAALVAHTHHPVHSAGSRCYNCHMSYTTYGLLKAIRSHTIDSPDVATTLSTGRPNACNQCHLDRTLAWTANSLSDWYGIAAPELTDEQQTVAASILWTLKGDAGQRALMAWSFGWSDAQSASGTDWMAPYLAQLLQDSYAAVRFIAFRSLRRVPGYLTVPYDFIGGDEHWTAVADQVQGYWQSRREPIAPEKAAAVLMDPQRRIAQEQFDKLLQQRDQRPIDLFE
ncbi:MAG: cytochrome c3 family protein, partial [Fuerstiella sp.]